MCRELIRGPVFVGEGKEEALGRGRNWAVMQSPRSLSQLHGELRSWGGPAELPRVGVRESVNLCTDWSPYGLLFMGDAAVFS